MAQEDQIIDVVIPITSGVSPVVDLTGLTIVEIYTPSSWTAAAIVPYSAPTLTGTYAAMYDDNPDTGGTAISHGAGASRAIIVDELIYAHRRYVKFAADGQAAARTIKLKVVTLRSLARTQI
jgi:hypothetical protein